MKPAHNLQGKIIGSSELIYGRPQNYLRVAQFVVRSSYLAHILPRVVELNPLKPENPVDGLGAVDDLETLVRGEERVAVGQDAKVPLAHE